MKVDKKLALQVVGVICGIGSVVVGAISKKDEQNAAAEKAAEIVMEKLNTNS